MIGYIDIVCGFFYWVFNGVEVCVVVGMCLCRGIGGLLILVVEVVEKEGFLSEWLLCVELIIFCGWRW